MKGIGCVLFALLMSGSLIADPNSDFIAADKNGDDRISLKEYKKYRASIMKKQGWSDPYHQIISGFDNRDRDHDGYLSFCEMRVAIVCNRLRDAFRAHDGRLTYKEYISFIERMLQDQGRYAIRCQEKDAFELRDRNGDGRLDQTEFVELSAKLTLRFQLADMDRNRELDIDEFEIYAVGGENLHLLKGISDAKGWVETIFENRDEDEDESLSRMELYESTAERKKQFRDADVNGDNSVTLEEMQEYRVRITDVSLWREMAMDQYRLNFITRDENADGIMTIGEYSMRSKTLDHHILFAAVK